MLAINQIEWVESPKKKHLKQKQMYFAWFASCRLLVWNAGGLMDEAEYKRSLKVSARSQICISNCCNSYSCLVLEADILNNDLESTIAKYKSYTSINYRSLCSGICHDIDTIATFRRTSDSNSHSKYIQKSASQGCCCCACAIRVLTRKPTM